VFCAKDVTDPNKSDLAMLDNLINRAVFKIFKVSEKLVIHDIRHFLGLHDVASGRLKTREWKTRHQTAGVENAGV